MLLHHHQNSIHLCKIKHPFSNISSSSQFLRGMSIALAPGYNNPFKPLAPSSFAPYPSIVTARETKQSTLTYASSSAEVCTGNEEAQVKGTEGKSFWGAVSLIIGTAVGPGMLGLPSATIKSGPLPSTITILLSWVYVVSSILLVAELTFAAMEEGKVGEVSFTGLATNALGSRVGAFVALVYALLSFALMVACVSGIGALILQWFPSMNPILAHSLFPGLVGTVIGFFPFKTIDLANRLLCCLMLVSITALVVVGSSVGRSNLLSSFAYASWSPSTILPAVPVTVLTLGFHVVTPFVCKLVGKTAMDAQKAILVGGAVPLLMVLSWNLVVLGLSGTAASEDPIGLLLSVNPLALPAVKGFAFSALGTSLIGYAVSLPKQLLDTFELIEGLIQGKQLASVLQEPGKVGFLVYTRNKSGISGHVSFGRTAKQVSEHEPSNSPTVVVTLLALVAPVVVASFFPAAFSAALDFAGVYANCFLCGVLPPLMAWIRRSRKGSRSSSSGDGYLLLRGGDATLLLLFTIAVILGIWH
ncbi:hypothetical protein H6P81_003067 [Aristolochia fimbriata]|uniref:Tyrosine-specific transport protein n=1 Tax=Aristolochia fimbriata TaxID=158543 RepID=A0AAV7FDC5_ARIFI|nr:hypothetical protein H6P81_003067 [Aristolochia fimbriata]